MTVLQNRARDGKKALVVGHKALADRLRGKELPDTVHVAHFGALRGSNDYAACESIFITGRNQPPPSEVEALARALYWQDEEPLTFDAGARPDASPEDHLPTELRGYRTADPDEACGVKVRTFSDPRIEAVHAQIREAETTQALARLRMVRSDHPKEVFILSNLPVDVTVDRVVSWDDLMPNALDRTLVETGSLPLTAKGLHRMHPDRFETEKKAEHTISRQGRGSYTPYQPSLHRYSRIEVTFRQDRDGKPFGKTQRHLFDVENPSWAGGHIHMMTASLPDLSTIKATLESAWGPIHIEAVAFVGAP